MIALLLVLIAADPVDRVAHVEAAIRAYRDATVEVRQRSFEYVRVLEQGACASEVERLKLDCLITASRRYCRGKDQGRCELVMDLAVTNLLAQQRLITTERRYEIMKQSKDLRRELAKEIRRIQGALAVDFRLREGDSAGDSDLAKKIDHYCLITADASSLPWQICAASLVTFIAVP